MDPVVDVFHCNILALLTGISTTNKESNANIITGNTANAIVSFTTVY